MGSPTPQKEGDFTQKKKKGKNTLKDTDISMLIF